MSAFNDLVLIIYMAGSTMFSPLKEQTGKSSTQLKFYFLPPFVSPPISFVASNIIKIKRKVSIVFKNNRSHCSVPSSLVKACIWSWITQRTLLNNSIDYLDLWWSEVKVIAWSSQFGYVLCLMQRYFHFHTVWWKITNLFKTSASHVVVILTS